MSESPEFKIAPNSKNNATSTESSVIPKDEKEITLTLLSHESTAEAFRAEILMEPKVHTIKLESDTDWPTVIATTLVGVAGILTTLLVGWFAHVVQKNQIRSNTANFRHAWQNQLREKTSEFLAKIALMHYRSKRINNYFNTPDSDIEYSDLIKIQATIMLMLDSKKDYAKDINNLMEDCSATVKSGSAKELNKKVNELTTKANEILELAWNDIKNDLGVRL